jgi:hypothetical protein
VTCEEAADIYVAADYLLIEPLKKLCCPIMTSNLGLTNIWPVLNKLLASKLTDAAKACTKVNKIELFIIISQMLCIFFFVKQGST